MTDVIDAVREFVAHRDRLNKISMSISGADFAAERGWLSPAELEELKLQRAAWPQGIRALRDHTREVRSRYPAAFRAWLEGEASGHKPGDDYVRRVKAVLEGRREDAVFTFPDGDVD